MGLALRPRIVVLMLGVAAFFRAAGDAGAQKCCIPGLPFGQPSPKEVIWPLPPEQLRIRYLGSLHSEQELGRTQSLFERIKQSLAGTKPTVLFLQRPHDVFVDHQNQVYVSDASMARVVVFSASGKTIRMLGTDGPGKLVKPYGLGGDSRGRIYVADAPAKRVVVFGPQGEFVRAYGGLAILLNPVDVAVDTTRGLVYVADSYLHQIVVFDTAGAVVRRIGRNVGDLAAKRKALAATTLVSGVNAAEAPEAAGHHAMTTPFANVSGPRDMTENRGARPGEFRYPAYVAVARDGTLYVSDGMNFRVQSFAPDGRFLREFGGLGDTPGSFARPKGVAVDGEGHVYVVDAAFNNLQIFDSEAHLLLAFGGHGRGPGELWLPMGLFIDGQNRIYVADRYNARIQVYQFVSAPPTAAPASASAGTERR